MGQQQRKSSEKTTEDQAGKMILSLSKQLGIAGDQLLQRASSRKLAAKALLSYLRRITILAESDRSEMAMMLGSPETGVKNVVE